MKPIRRRNPTKFYLAIYQVHSQQGYFFRIRIFLWISLTFCIPFKFLFHKYFFQEIMFFTEKNVLLFWAIIWFLPYEIIFYSPWKKHWCLIKGEGKKQVTTKHENSRRNEMRLAPIGWVTVPTGIAARAGSSLPGFLLPAKGQYGVVFCNWINTPVQPWLS